MKKSQESSNKPEERGQEAVLTSKGVARLQSGHLWIYRSDLQRRPTLESGSVVRVVDQRGRFLAWAHFGAESEISLRVLSRDPEEAINRRYWEDRLRKAEEWRHRVVSGGDCYRLVHGEGDALPGLVIDRYGDSFSIQTLTRGMDRLKSMWVELLVELFKPRQIVERNDARVRQLEGLPLLSGILYQSEQSRSSEIRSEEQAGDLPQDLIVTENGIRFVVDLIGGQKTGAFLDQRENRAVARQLARGRGLDCFSFHGSFALHIAEGCESVTALDISLPAIERARRNAELNGITNIDFIETNVFDKLREYDDAGERFDTIVLDPPAFARNRGALEGALRGYKEINLRAMRLLAPGGVLITCSCSYHVGEELFMEMLVDASRDAGRMIQVIEKRTQGRDHPMLLTVPETFYLKCVVLRIA